MGPEIVSYLSSIENAGAKKELQRELRNSIAEGNLSTKEIIAELKENVKKHGLSEPEAVTMIWSAVMSAIEWNKKEDLLQEQVRLLALLLSEQSRTSILFMDCGHQ